AATFCPCLRNQSMAASKSPLVSVSALRQSIIPAPVIWRSLLISCALIVTVLIYTNPWRGFILVNNIISKFSSCFSLRKDFIISCLLHLYVHHHLVSCVFVHHRLPDQHFSAWLHDRLLPRLLPAIWLLSFHFHRILIPQLLLLLQPGAQLSLLRSP